MNASLIAGLLIAATLPVPARVPPPQAGPDRAWLKSLRKPSAGAAPVMRNLPDARGREFRTLDEYLAHLRAFAAPVDRPWYREVRPGVYRRETGNLRGLAPPRLLTREALKRRFGFRR